MSGSVGQRFCGLVGSILLVNKVNTTIQHRISKTCCYELMSHKDNLKN